MKPISLTIAAFLAGTLLLATSTFTGAQEPDDPIPDSTGTERLRVFLDCPRCDFDFLRREIPTVDYVRDREVSDVHVIVTLRRTGAGGQEYTFRFLGRGDLEGRADTLVYASRQTQTDAEVRDGYARTLGLGLVRYMAYASQASGVDLRFTDPSGLAAPPSEEQDPWNLWIFRMAASAEFEGEDLERSRTLDGSFSASRTTAEFKVDFEMNAEYEREDFDFETDGGETRTRTTTSTEIDGEAVAVWSLGPHWSWGLSSEAGTDTPANQDLFLRAGPALEFSVFPYAQSSSRQITALYRIGFAHFQYGDTTVFNLLEETRPEQALGISADFRQPWGELVVSIEGSHFLDDLDQHRVDVFTNLEIRLFQGFNLDIRGNVARVKDQIYLPLGEVDDVDRLTGRVQLGTDFEYSIDFGFSFIFGSVFNNVVNPRLRL